MIGQADELVDGGGGDGFVGESVKRAGDLDEPGVLLGVVEPVEVFRQVTDADERVNSGSNQFGRHAGRVGEFGIVVITQDLIDPSRRRAVGVDVRVRVEDGPGRHLVEELTCPRVARYRVVFMIAGSSVRAAYLRPKASRAPLRPQDSPIVGGSG